MSVEFYKYHGLGNDFLVCEGTERLLSGDEIVQMCRRHRGVGADGVILAEPTVTGPDPEMRMIIYNRDGSRPEMCGNGIRCVAAWAVAHRDFADEMVIHSDAGPRRCRVVDDREGRWSVTVGMGPAVGRTETSPLEVDDRRFEYVEVDVGNPHAVIFEEPNDELVERIGRYANDSHPAFPRGVNVELTSREESGRYRAVVYERGVGRTRACGTGACAVAEAVWTTGRARRDRPVEVRLPGGVLTLEHRDEEIWMTGPAREVFTGVWRS